MVRAQPSHLPLPLAKGGYAGYLVPAPLSGPLGFHVRGTLIAAPGEQDLAIGGQVGLSMSFLYGEAGASFYGAALLARDAAPVQRRGPIEVWMRLGPLYPVGKLRSGLVVAAFGEYAVARAEVDAGGTVIPETTTVGLVAGWHKGWTEAHLSGAYQRGVDGESTYHGAQLGGAVWLRFFHALQAGAEGLVRSGCFAGTATCRPGAMGLIGLRALDRHGVGGGLAAGLGFGEDMPAWMVMGRFGFTVGEGFKPPPRTTDLEQDIRDWLAARARRRAEEAQQLAQQQLAQQQLAQQQLAQAAAQRQALVQALAQRYPLGGGPPPPLVSPVCVRRPCQVAGWRLDQAVDEAVRGAWSKPDEPVEPVRPGPGRGIAQVPPWRPPPRPPVRPPRTGQPGRSPMDAREPIQDRESGEREARRRAQERERERVWGTPEMPRPVYQPTPYPTLRPDPRVETADHGPPPLPTPWLAPAPPLRPALAPPPPRPAPQFAEHVDQPVVRMQQARGGTYVLVDKTGQVMRVGRTNDLVRREKEHKRDKVLGRYDFRVDLRTNNYAAQRGREQQLHDQHKPPLDKINPINPKSPRRQFYLDAATRVMQTMTHGPPPRYETPRR